MMKRILERKRQVQKAFYLGIPESDTVIVFVHGILESPSQFQFLAEIGLRQGMSVSALLLPGHGGSGEEFARTTGKQWIDYVHTHIKKLKTKFEHVILVGHSMGTLLLLSSYFKEKSQIIGFVGLAMPLKIRISARGFRCSINVALNRVQSSDRYTTALYHSYSIYDTKLFTYIKWIPRYQDLFRLSSSITEQLDKVSIPSLLVHCHQDEFVQLGTIETIKEKWENDSYTLLELKQSGHFYYIEEEKHQLEEAFENFLFHLMQKK